MIRRTPDPEVRTWVATELVAHAHQVPDALRAALTAKIARRLTPAVRAADPTTLAATSAALAALTAEAELVALVDDPTAAKRFADLPTSPMTPEQPLRARRLIAARIDPTLTSAQLVDLGHSANEFPTLAEALAANPTIMSVVANAGPLPYGMYRRLFKRQCSPAERVAALAVIDAQLTDDEHDKAAAQVAGVIDGCIADRAALEPVFRAWLAPTPSSRLRRAR